MSNPATYKITKRFRRYLNGLVEEAFSLPPIDLTDVSKARRVVPQQMGSRKAGERSSTQLQTPQQSNPACLVAPER
jgi:hypothetical protein